MTDVVGVSLSAHGDKKSHSTMYRVTKRVTEPTKGVTDAEKCENVQKVENS